jgi:meso-butanediol dehydrogenase/(S,S)-butanediol dehydrogenase/diacetyl reductase
MGLVAAPTSSLYGMAKAALIHLTKSMAVELARDGISVNCVSPGPIETEFTRSQMALRPGYREEREAEVPLRRWGSPEEVAELIGFLASTGATFIHGSNFLIDGGYTAH